MKKLLNIGFLLTVSFCTLNVYGDGGMTSGNKNCTQNCGGLFGGVVTEPTLPEVKTTDDSTLVDVYTWVVNTMSDLLD